MSILGSFTRVNRGLPCPVCEHRDWCLVRINAAGQIVAAVCPRARSETRWGNAGFLHVLDRSEFRHGRVRPGLPPAPTRDFGSLAKRLQESAPAYAVNWYARDLKVSSESLRDLRFGLVEGADLRRVGARYIRRAWSVPMEDSQGRVIGIRLRQSNGRKFAVKGSRNGLFVPKALDDHGPLFIAEGETDAAALLTLGLRVVGRPGAMACQEMLVRYVRDHEERNVVVVADADEVGLFGAQQLAGELRSGGVRARVLVPDAEDARAWIVAGATRDDVLAHSKKGGSAGEARGA